MQNLIIELAAPYLRADALENKLQNRLVEKQHAVVKPLRSFLGELAGARIRRPPVAPLSSTNPAARSAP